jgi:hypothetical protein
MSFFTIYSTSTGIISHAVDIPADWISAQLSSGQDYIEGHYSAAEYTINTTTQAPVEITITPPTLTEYRATASAEIANVSAGKVGSRSTEFMIVMASGDSGAISDFHAWINSVLAASNAAISAINTAANNAAVDSAKATGIANILAL